MHTFSNKFTKWKAFFVTVITIFLSGLFFSVLFTTFPLRSGILTVFAHVSLGLAVFAGAYFHSRRQTFLRFRNFIFLPLLCSGILLFAMIMLHAFNLAVFLQKTLTVWAAAVVGEITGRLI